MRFDGLQQVAGAAVMQEEDPLTDAPQRSRAELIRSGATLVDSIRQVRAHVVNREIRERVELNSGQRSVNRVGTAARSRAVLLSGHQRLGVAQHASNLFEQREPV